MQPIQHQMMGYDRAITMFSPDGRLLQVEYAKKTVRLGNTAIGLVCKDGVLLVTDKRLVDKLVVPEAIEKIFKIDDHIMATAAGIISDARVLVEQGQVKSQQHRVTYDYPIDIVSIVKHICDIKQICTQSGGLRPFGVSLLIAGIDEDGKKKLFETDPTGIYYQYKASVIGEGEPEIEEILHKEYKETMSIDDGLKLCVKALKKVLDSNFNAERIDAAFIDENKRVMKKISKEKIRKFL
ncbi:archaeal proteasome endopeptidase complex subunit alpha [Candidatus Woesearchaeota archaeon]|nr:archaeal proteasome endopeptidase complex subunit alpha [Candidatus Woesearchaeota archaeon]